MRVKIIYEDVGDGREGLAEGGFSEGLSSGLFI